MREQYTKPMLIGLGITIISIISQYMIQASESHLIISIGIQKFQKILNVSIFGIILGALIIIGILILNFYQNYKTGE